MVVKKNPDRKKKVKTKFYYIARQEKMLMDQWRLKMLVDHFAEPFGAHWDGEKSMGIKHIQTCLNSDVSEMAKVQ